MTSPDLDGQLQADEDFKYSVVVHLRELGHDVQSAVQAGIANVRLADEHLLAHCAAAGRVLLTRNRNDYVRLHRAGHAHQGIVACRQAGDPALLAANIHSALALLGNTSGILIRVYLDGPPLIELPPG